MKKTYVIALSLIAAAATSSAAVFQTVTASGNPSTNGWSLDNGNEFTSGGNWAIFGTENAVRSFGNLLVGESVSIDLSTLGVASGDFVGVDFRDGATTGIGFNFEGGQTNYNVFSNSGVANSGIGFTTSFQIITLLNVDGTNYTLSADGTDFANLNLANSLTTINTIRVFNETSGAGNDVLFNNFTVVPEPGSFALLAGLLGLSYIAVRRR